jgi:hypothetical protein
MATAWRPDEPDASWYRSIRARFLDAATACRVGSLISADLICFSHLLRRRCIARLAVMEHDGVHVAVPHLPTVAAVAARAEARAHRRRDRAVRYRQIHSLVLHADDAPVRRRSDAARDDLRLHGRALRIRQRLACAQAVRGRADSARDARPDRRPIIVRSQTRCVSERVPIPKQRHTWRTSAARDCRESIRRTSHSRTRVWPSSA